MSLEAEEIAAIASHSIIFWCILSNKKVTALSKRIGDAVQLEIHSKEFLKKYSEKKLEDIINKNKLWQKLKALKIEVGQNSSDWTDTEKIRFGTHIIDLTISSCNFFKIDFEIINRVKTKVIDFSDKIYKDIENQHIKFETIRSPIFRPMICRPLEWTTINDGGYISTSCTLVKNIKKEHGRLLEKSNLNLIYKSLNLIQNTAWNINENVLNTILDWNRLGNPILIGEKTHYQEPPKKPKKQKEDKSKWAEWYRQKELYKKYQSKLIQSYKAVEIAKEFTKERVIYFPHYLDWRGRVYPFPQILNPQGNDIAKGLLAFHKKKPIGEHGAKWLSVHIANLFGQNKSCYSDRVKWSFVNNELLLDSAEKPITGERFWTKADKPWSALAACFEWRNLSKYGENLKSNLVVHLVLQRHFNL